MVIVSHDREFLDQLCTKVVETERGVATTYKGAGPGPGGGAGQAAGGGAGAGHRRATAPRPAVSGSAAPAMTRPASAPPRLPVATPRPPAQATTPST